MRSGLRGILPQVFSCTLFVALMAHAPFSLAQEYVPGEIIVKLKSKSGSSESFAFLGKAASTKAMTLKQSFGRMNMHHMGLRKGQSVEDALAELRADPEVEYAEPNYILRKSSEGVVEQTFSLDQMQQIRSESAGGMALTGDVDIGLDYGSMEVNESLGAGASRPVVAVIDTGLDLNHPVFKNTNSVWMNPGETGLDHLGRDRSSNGIDDDGNGYVDDVSGWNFVDNSKLIYDDDDHGTHVSGIILSVDQDITVSLSALVESQIAIMPLKFLDGSGVGSTSNAIKAIYYAVQNGATVLNNSWGGPTYSGALHEAISYAYSQGVSFVAAAGNGDSSGNGYNIDQSPMYPAAYDVPNIISVAAIKSDLSLARFSNFGHQKVHLGSPGVWIYSTIPGGYFGTMSGTSMATPYVAGVAAQMKVVSPSMMGYQIKSIILGQTLSTSPLLGKVYSEGRLNVTDSIDYASTASVETSQPYYAGSYLQNRELASTIAGGGCGMVGKLGLEMAGRFRGGGPGSGVPQTWYVIVVLTLLAAPFFLVAWLKSRDPANRRRYERFQIQSSVRINVGDRELVGSVSTISMGGVQVNTNELIAQGGIVKMHICSPDGKEQIEVEGHVVWSEENKAYGVAFDQAPRSVLHRISEWTRALPKAG